MAGLATRPPAGARLAKWLGSIERIGRWGRRAIGGIALELDEEFSDLGFEGGDPNQGDIEFTTQLEASGTVGDWGRFERDHRI
jgi:hypothetical protein